MRYLYSRCIPDSMGSRSELLGVSQPSSSYASTWYMLIIVVNMRNEVHIIGHVAIFMVFFGKKRSVFCSFLVLQNGSKNNQVWANRCIGSVLFLLCPGPGSAHELQQLRADIASGWCQCIPHHLGSRQ